MFETSQQTNQRLYRNILNGKQYEGFFPKSYCKRLSGGKGNTEYSVNQMVRVVELYGNQTQKVAQKLKKSSLVETAQAVQDFLYWHFQYKRDEQDQMLRSPACSFAQRFEGIDCKSYSILGASILRELGYVSYFRRVSYGQSQPYSHVYVVVPKNQKTADLSQGYYTIDGTINKTTETENYFYKHSDTLVMKLDHYILNAPQNYNYNGLTEYQRAYLWQRGIDPNTYGLGADEGGGDGNWLNTAVAFFENFNWKQISINNIKKLFSCSDSNSAFKSEHYKHNIVVITNMINEDIGKMNDYLSKKDYLSFTKEAKKILNKHELLAILYKKKKQSKNWNRCSDEKFNATIQFFGGDPENYQMENPDNMDGKFGAVFAALRVWLNSNFNLVGVSEVIDYTLTQKAEYKDAFLGIYDTFFLEETGTTTIGEKTNTIYAPKTDKEEITFFEMTPYLENILKNETNETFSKTDFLNSLKNFATLFYSATTNVPAPPPPKNNNYNVSPPKNNNVSPPKNNNYNVLPPKYNLDLSKDVRQAGGTKQAGATWLMAGVLITAGISYMIMKNKK